MIIIALVLGALAIVWYFILVAIIGWLVGARPCRECLANTRRATADQ